MAVYTEVNDRELVGFLAGYNIGALLSYKGIAEGVENTNYLLQTTTGSYILTLYERRVDPADLPFFLGLMHHLAERGVTCPLPVKARNGAFLGTLGGRRAVIITFLEGVWPRQPSVAQCHALGRTMAEMHTAAQDFALTRQNALGPQNWRPLFQSMEHRLPEISANLAPLIARELDAIDARWPQTLPSGVIHADLFPDNVFFIGDRLSGVIDFYFACNDFLAYDIAVSINAWCFDAEHRHDVHKSAALIGGYESVRPLMPAERQALPTLARGAAMRFLLTRSYDWLNTPPNALVARKDPHDYIARLAFHAAATSIDDYTGGVSV